MLSVWGLPTFTQQSIWGFCCPQYRQVPLSLSLLHNPISPAHMKCTLNRAFHDRAVARLEALSKFKHHGCQRVLCMCLPQAVLPHRGDVRKAHTACAATETRLLGNVDKQRRNVGLLFFTEQRLRDMRPPLKASTHAYARESRWHEAASCVSVQLVSTARARMHAPHSAANTPLCQSRYVVSMSSPNAKEERAEALLRSASPPLELCGTEAARDRRPAGGLHLCESCRSSERECWSMLACRLKDVNTGENVGSFPDRLADSAASAEGEGG